MNGTTTWNESEIYGNKRKERGKVVHDDDELRSGCLLLGFYCRAVGLRDL